MEAGNAKCWNVMIQFQVFMRLSRVDITTESVYSEIVSVISSQLSNICDQTKFQVNRNPKVFGIRNLEFGISNPKFEILKVKKSKNFTD
jgi:hypothetical protein